MVAEIQMLYLRAEFQGQRPITKSTSIENKNWTETNTKQIKLIKMEEKKN
jgi:hypothetical protein